MADKNVTVTEPTAEHVRQVRISYKKGIPVRVDVIMGAPTSDADVNYNANCSDSDLSVYDRDAIGKMTDIAKTVAARVVASRGF